MSRSLIPEPVSADKVLARLERSLAKQGETVRLIPRGDGPVQPARYYRAQPEAPDGWVRISCPGARAEYPLGDTDRRLLGLPALH